MSECCWLIIAPVGTSDTSSWSIEQEVQRSITDTKRNSIHANVTKTLKCSGWLEKYNDTLNSHMKHKIIYLFQK